MIREIGKAIARGVVEFHAGARPEDNPYDDEARREGWLRGWHISRRHAP